MRPDSIYFLGRREPPYVSVPRFPEDLPQKTTALRRRGSPKALPELRHRHRLIPKKVRNRRRIIKIGSEWNAHPDSLAKCRAYHTECLNQDGPDRREHWRAGEHLRPHFTFFSFLFVISIKRKTNMKKQDPKSKERALCYLCFGSYAGSHIETPCTLLAFNLCVEEIIKSANVRERGNSQESTPSSTPRSGAESLPKHSEIQWKGIWEGKISLSRRPGRSSSPGIMHE